MCYNGGIRMRRWLLCLVPWMAMTAAAGQEDTPRPAGLIFTHHEAAQALRLGDECYVAPSLFKTWGWPYSLVQNDATIQAEGRTVRLTAKTFDNKIYLPLKPALDQLGAGYKWDRDTLQVWGVARFITFKNGKLSVDSTLAGKPTITHLDSPERVVIDFKGIRMTNSTKANVTLDARCAQYSQDTLRITIQTDKEPGYRADLGDPTREFSLSLVEEDTDVARIYQAQGVEPGKGTTSDPDPQANEGDEERISDDPEIKPKATKAPVLKDPVTVQPLLVTNDTSRSATLSVALSKASTLPPKFKRIDPLTLELTIPNAKYGADSNKSFGESVRSVDVREEAGSVIFTIKLTRAMGLELSNTPKGVQLFLIKPNVGNGRLSGKTVVVDAGHGGKDSGCPSPDKKVHEKNITLKLAMALSEELASEGATVIMTRKDDVFIELKERAMVANRNAADFFLSIHVDSNTVKESRTGGTVYFHGGSTMGSLLADCVEAELKKMGTIPSRGARSDKKLYTNGLSVLRNSTMPAVLVETGFMNHSTDRKHLQSDAHRTAFSKAVVRGLKMYLGDGQNAE